MGGIDSALGRSARVSAVLGGVRVCPCFCWFFCFCLAGYHFCPRGSLGMASHGFGWHLARAVVRLWCVPSHGFGWLVVGTIQLHTICTHKKTPLTVDVRGGGWFTT